jgi:lycopene beta-cyclase
MSAANVDIVIAGGGLAGLAMALALSEPHFAHLKIMLVEPRAHYTRDRTWSYWYRGEHPLGHLERARWSQWRVRARGRDALCSGAHSYRSVDADTFYAHALERIARSPHIQLRLGDSLRHIDPGWPCQFTLASGQRLQTQLLLDARGPPHTNPPGMWAQHFVGWEIETDIDTFNPEVVELMDFMPTPHPGVHFFYTLPYSPRRALVETTWLSRPDHRPDYAQQLRNYLSQRYPHRAYRTVFEERGSLGLTHITAPKPTGPILPLGRAAGCLRASTGFAYLDTLADCARLSQQLIRCPFPLTESNFRTHLQPFQRSRIDQCMDQIFLRVITEHPAQAPALFTRLFTHTPSTALVQFLSGHATLWERAQVARSLPAGLFLRACLPRITP